MSKSTRRGGPCESFCLEVGSSRYWHLIFWFVKSAKCWLNVSWIPTKPLKKAGILWKMCGKTVGKSSDLVRMKI